LVRVVRTPELRVEIDETGKKSGRGAYVCRTAACWRLALDKGALGRALNTSLTSGQVDELRRFMASLPEGPEDQP